MPVMSEVITQVVTSLGDDPVERRVLEILVERTGTPAERIARESSIPDLTDSLGVVEIIMDLEDEFEGSIPDEEAEKLVTVGLLIDYVKTHLAAVKTGA